MADPSDLDFGATVRSFAPGQRFFGRFTLVRALGRGGMGVVWLAHDEKLELDVAVKFLPEAVGGDEAAVAELARETRRARELRHQHIVGVYDFHQDERLAGISMEWIDGGTLTSHRLQQPNQFFEPAQLSGWVEQIAEALDYAHRRAKVVHRDLKPANLMVGADGYIKITDFGISASVSESVTRVSRIASSSGSPPYMSPQQMLGERPSPSDDIYGLGATLYELLTGKPPFHSGAIAMQVQSVVPPTVAGRRREFEKPSGNIPAAWEETIAACLAKRPEDRPRSAGDVAARLRRNDTAAAADSPGDSPTVVLPIRKKEPEQSPSAPEAEPGPPPSSGKARRPRVPRPPARSEPVNRVEEPERSERKEAAPVNAPDTPVRTPAPGVVKPAPVPATAKPVPAPIAAKPVPVPVPAKAAEPPPVRKHRFVGLVVIAAVVIGAFVFWRRGPARPAESPRENTGLTTSGGDGAGSTVAPGTLVIGRNAPDAPPLGSWTSKPGPVVGQPWENTLGMKFVPVPGTEVLFCIWETRVQDYEAFSQATNRGWTKSEEAAHPAVNVSWDEAQAFCRWLTERERAAGRLAPSEEYRLPRDWEWSVAVGLSEPRGGTPESKETKIENVFPWGTQWPSPRGAGNYADATAKRQNPSWAVIDGYDDGYASTAPVGSFGANRFGLHDLGGNVWEWAEDFYDGTSGNRALRGASFYNVDRDNLLSSRRGVVLGLRSFCVGFRVVCASGGASSPALPAGSDVTPTSEDPKGIAGPVAGRPWENTLGMKFVPVPGVDALFSVWETRVQDYEAFTDSTNREWTKPDFVQGPTHPAVNVSWDDAQAFCVWLTQKERADGRRYRLPTDAEWSVAVGLAGESGSTPKEKNGKIADVYVWGTQWPPPSGAGNYDTSLKVDNIAETAPEGSFSADRHALFDLGGNVWEWCEDFFDGLAGARVLRGASWNDYTPTNLLSSSRGINPAGSRYANIGFRVVLVGASAP